MKRKFLQRSALYAVFVALAVASCGEPPREVEPPVSRADARGTEGLDPDAFDSLPWAPGRLDRATGTYLLSVPRPDLVVTVDGERTAYAVRRECTTGNPALLAGPVPVG